MILAYPYNQITSPANGSNPKPGDPSPTLSKTDAHPLLVNITPINTQIGLRSEKLGEGTGLGIGNPGDPMYTLQAAHSHALFYGYGVRRITPTEAERLQGFPDGYTAIPGAADGPRYKIMGNSMATDVIAWLGRRIDDVDKQMKNLKLS